MDNTFIAQLIAKLDPSKLGGDVSKIEQELNKKGIKLKTVLDKSTTKQEMNNLVRELQSALSDIGLNIDTNVLRNTINQMAKEVPKIFNTSELDKQGKIYVQKVRNTVEASKKELESKLKNAGYTDIQIKGVEDTTGKVQSLTATVTDATGAIKQLNFEREKLQGKGKAQYGFVQTDDVKVLGNVADSISTTASKLETLKQKWTDNGVLVGDFKTKVEQLETSLGNVSSKSQLDKLKTDLQELTTEASKISKANEIQLSIDNGHGASEYQNRINSLINDFQRYGVSVDEAKNVTQNLRNTFNSMKDLSGQELISAADKFEQEFRNVKISIDEAKLSYDKLTQPASKEKISSTLVKVQNLLSKNKNVTREVKAEWEGYVTTLSSGANKTEKEINDINLRLKETEAEMRKAGRLGNTFFGSIKEGIKSFSTWLSATTIFMGAVNSVRKMASAVYEIDTAMTNLYKVTDETEVKYNQFLDNATNKSQKLGRSISSLIEQTANWAKLGYSIDEAEKLAEVSSIYANVGEVSDDTAVSDIVTAMKAFNLEASDAISIVDKLNALGNKYATSSGDLGTGLSNAASSLALAGNSIDESLAMITAMTEITQDASESGNALKILSMRVRGYDEETESYSNSVEELTGKIADLTKTASTPGGISLFTDDTKETYKSTYQLLNEISKVWDELTDKNKAELLEVLAGKQRGNSISALLTNMSQANNALNTSLESAGSAYEEQSRWMESLEAKTQQFESAFQSLAQTILDSDFLKGLVDIGTDLVNVLDWGIDKFGALSTTIIGLGTYTLGKNNLDWLISYDTNGAYQVQISPTAMAN